LLLYPFHSNNNLSTFFFFFGVFFGGEGGRVEGWGSLKHGVNMLFFLTTTATATATATTTAVVIIFRLFLVVGLGWVGPCWGPKPPSALFFFFFLLALFGLDWVGGRDGWGYLFFIYGGKGDGMRRGGVFPSVEIGRWWVNGLLFYSVPRMLYLIRWCNYSLSLGEN
jgi:hypothetical protein